jgi:hypothetical protein|eukprot:COSAG01_NODE_3328_length_6249_cov_3.493821_9_plen_77_part_00
MHVRDGGRSMQISITDLPKPVDRPLRLLNVFVAHDCCWPALAGFLLAEFSELGQFASAEQRQRGILHVVAWPLKYS